MSSKGFAVSCALEFLGAILGAVLYVSHITVFEARFVDISWGSQVSYKTDNTSRDRKYGKVADTDATVETRELADQVNFAVVTV